MELTGTPRDDAIVLAAELTKTINVFVKRHGLVPEVEIVEHRSFDRGVDEVIVNIPSLKAY